MSPSQMRSLTLDGTIVPEPSPRRPRSWWRRWRRRLFIGVPTSLFTFGIAAWICWTVDARTGHSRSIHTFIVWNTRYHVWKYSEPVRPWNPSTPTHPVGPRTLTRANDLFQITNIWPVHIDFTRQQWRALAPRRVPALEQFATSDGNIILRNSQAPRTGFAGVLGYAFDWTQANIDIAGARFTNIAIRVKGNVGALAGDKHPFKVDLNQFVKGQKLAGLDELTLNNIMWDYSYLADALGHEFFRDCGVPAPRTAFAWLTVTVADQKEKPLGLYLMVESIDKNFVAEHFGSRQTPLFKPVTYNLFESLGDDWSAYAPIYDLKTKATSAQKQRLIEFSKLVSYADDAEFTHRAGEFLDLDEFARFLAGEVLLSNYDSLLSTGQNYFLYLDPRSNKFGFIPWDLDAAWGEFWIGTKHQLERASIWHPWVGPNRFLERVMATEEFRAIYRKHLEDFLARLLVPDRLQKRMDDLAPIIRSPLSAESSFRLSKFEQTVGAVPVTSSRGETEQGFNRRAHPTRRFVEARAKSVRDQLDGKSDGIILKPLFK